MIFATVGTHGQGFPRMLDALREIAADGVIVQYGHGRPPDWAQRAAPFMPFDEVLRLMAEAEAVVTHAGVGSVLCARRTGHVPVVVPRLARLGEHVDDHQADLTLALAERGDVVAVWEGDSVRAALERVGTRGERCEPSETPLHAAVRQALLP